MGMLMSDITSTIDINWDKQNRHIRGTTEHEAAIQSGKNLSIFLDPKTAEKYVTDAWLTGDHDESRAGAGNRRVQTYKEITGYDSDGNPLYQVKVVDSKVGKHGYPCGDGLPGKRTLPENMGKVDS